MPPLNPDLYAALKEVFGDVKVSKQGVPMTAVYWPGLDGQPRLHPAESGEYYAVNCPFCYDTGQHLYINHRYGVRDPVTGFKNHWLANCFLSGCMTSRENREELARQLHWYRINAGAICVPLQKIEELPPLEAMDLPEDFKPLTALPLRNQARRYLFRRGFTPKILSRDWGVGYSRDGCDWWASGRVIIPLHAYLPDQGWIVVGWQGRAIDPDERIRYYTAEGTPKSRLLYGLDHVSADGRPVLICEGVTDVWKAGHNAVAILGKHISAEQRKLIREHLSDRPLVVMLDPDAADQAKVVAGQIRETLNLKLTGKSPRSRVVVARLPDGRDPGDCTREEIWKIADDALTRSRRTGRSK
jgi:hypothetical protein